MFDMRYAEQSDRAFWYTLEQEMNEAEFALKVRDRRCYILSEGDKPVGIMRYNLIYDSIPFLTLILLAEAALGRGFGKQAVRRWESEMRELGHSLVMTSTQSDEQAQHFYRKLGYKDAGCLLLDTQPLEIFLLKAL